MKLFLRVGVMHAGKLIDDRYLHETGNVTFGTGAENTFTLLGGSLPETRTLVHFEGHHPVLHVVDGMTGELALDGKARQPLASLQSKGKAGSGEWQLQLPDAARGWVSFGGITFFVQQVPKPPPPPPTTLPKEARTGFLSGLESMFVGVLVAVMSIESIGVAAIHRRPSIEPDQLGQTEDLDRFVQVQTEEEKPKPKEEKKEEKKEDEKKEKEAEKKENKPATTEQAKAERAAKVQEQAHKAVLDILGGGDGEGSAFDRVVSNDSASLAGIDDAMKNARGGVAMVDDGIRGPRGGSGGGAQSIGDLAASIGGGGGGKGNAKVALSEKKGVAAPVEIETSLIDMPATSFSSAELVRAIKGRMGAVKSCYDRELKLDPNLKGKISMRFTITPLGRVSEVSVDRDTMHSDAVSECIMRLIRTWTFSFKPEDEVSVSFPFVFTQSG